MIITVDILKEIAPGSSKTKYKLLPELANEMNRWFPQFYIDEPLEFCHFLAQAAHETDSFNSLEEYADGTAYEMRKDLGNTVKGWGKRYKGRGVFQTTGFTNYKRLNDLWDGDISFIIHPELLEQPHFAVWSACQFWKERDFNSIATASTIFSKTLKKNLSALEYITWRINGSLSTVPERAIFFDRCKAIIK